MVLIETYTHSSSTNIYIISYIIFKKKHKLPFQHRIWNILLLITFLISAILGVILIIRAGIGVALLPVSVAIFWHVETGIAMMPIAIYHIPRFQHHGSFYLSDTLDDESPPYFQVEFI